MDLNYKEISNLNERNYKKLLKNYKFNQEDATSLKSLKNMANNYSKELLDGFYEFIFEFDHAKMFLHNKEILTRHERGIKNWYLNLFCGILYGGTFVGLVALFMNLGGKLAGKNPVMLMGALTTAYGIGQVTAPLYAVSLTNLTGNYNYALYLTAMIVLFGVIILLIAKKVTANSVN